MKTETTKSLADQIREYKPCRAAMEWIGDKTLDEAWEKCERGDWMLWLAGMVGVDRKVLVRASCLCARTALIYVNAGELRPLKAIEMAESWCEGNATTKEVRSAASSAASYAAAYAAAAAAASASAYAAYASASAYAAYAAAAAAASAYAAAASAYAAAYAAYAAAAASYADASAYAAYAAAYAASASASASAADNIKSQKETAGIVRGIITVEMIRENL